MQQWVGELLLFSPTAEGYGFVHAHCGSDPELLNGRGCSSRCVEGYGDGVKGRLRRCGSWAAAVDRLSLRPRRTISWIAICSPGDRLSPSPSAASAGSAPGGEWVMDKAVNTGSSTKGMMFKDPGKHRNGAHWQRTSHSWTSHLQSEDFVLANLIGPFWVEQV